MDQIRSELDEYMGVMRNVPLNKRKSLKDTYDIPEVCKYNIVSVCPHDLFPNTKADLGKCSKRHEDYYRRMFLQDENRYPQEKRYVTEAINFFESLVAVVDNKIKKIQVKNEALAKEEEDNPELQENAIDAEIKKQIQLSEMLGEQGQVEEAEKCIALIENLRKRKEEFKLTGDPNSSRFMRTCEICGALQSANDTEKRTIAHLEGRLHTGYGILRKEIEALRKRKEELDHIAVLYKQDKDKKDKSPEKETLKNRSRSRDKSSHKSHKKSRSRDRGHRGDSRNKSRHHKYESKSHRRDRDRSYSSRSRSDSSSDNDRHRKRHRSDYSDERKGSRKSHRHGSSERRSGSKHRNRSRDRGSSRDRRR